MGFGVVRMVDSSFVFVKMLASELAFIHTTGNRPPPPTFSCTRTVLHVPLTGTPTYARREWLGQPCRTPAPRDVLPVGPRSGTEPPCPVGEAQGSLADPYLGPTRTHALGCIFALHRPSITSHSTPPRAVRHAPRSTLHTLPLGTYGCARPLELPSQSTSRVHFCLSGGALGVLWISCRRPVTISRLTLPFLSAGPRLHFSGFLCQSMYCGAYCSGTDGTLSKNPVLTAVPAGGVWRTQEKIHGPSLCPHRTHRTVLVSPEKYKNMSHWRKISGIFCRASRQWLHARSKPDVNELWFFIRYDCWHPQGPLQVPAKSTPTSFQLASSRVSASSV